MRFALSLIGALLVCALLTYGVRAVMLARRPPPVPVRELLPVEGLIQPGEGYERVALVPYDLPAFAFTIVVPRGSQGTRFTLTAAERSQEQQQALAMAEFLPPGQRPEAPVRIEVRYVRPPAQVTPDAFIDVYARASGFTIVARQPGLIGDVAVADALLRKTTPGRGPFVTRLLVRRHGALLFLVAGSVLESEYPRWRRTLGVAAVSLTPTGQRMPMPAPG